MVRRPWAQHRRENSLKPSWQTLVEQPIISTAEKTSARDCSCCLSFVIGVGFCQIGSWQHQHNSFFQVGIWESVKTVHPSPGSLAGKGTARMGHEARMDLFAGANLLLASSTDLCGIAAVPEQAGNLCHYPRDGSSADPRFLPPPQREFGLYPASGKNAHQNAGSVTRIAEALGERQSTHFALQIALPVHITSAQTSPGSQGNKLIYAHLIPFMRASSNTLG